MREKTVKRELECILTDAELKDYSKILATSVRERTKLEADLKSYVSHKKAEIETHNGTSTRNFQSRAATFSNTV